MKYLVDADVLSEPTKPTSDPRVVEWLRAHEPDLAVDPVILGELRFGILIPPKGRKRTALERWFNAGVGRLLCLPWDADTGLKWAELLARLRRAGKAMPIKDSLIAATAAVHGLAVATRNRADFVDAGVRIADPFAGRVQGKPSRVRILPGVLESGSLRGRGFGLLRYEAATVRTSGTV